MNKLQIRGSIISIPAQNFPVQAVSYSLLSENSVSAEDSSLQEIEPEDSSVDSATLQTVAEITSDDLINHSELLSHIGELLL